MRRFQIRFITTLLILLSVYTTIMAQSRGFDTSRMDTSANACTDFFQFANGTWLKNTEIPASESRWRVNGPLSNIPQFAEAFGCKAPSAMVRKDACLIW